MQKSLHKSNLVGGALLTAFLLIHSQVCFLCFRVCRDVVYLCAWHVEFSSAVSVREVEESKLIWNRDTHVASKISLTHTQSCGFTKNMLWTCNPGNKRGCKPEEQRIKMKALPHHLLKGRKEKSRFGWKHCIYKAAGRRAVISSLTVVTEFMRHQIIRQQHHINSSFTCSIDKRWALPDRNTSADAAASSHRRYDAPDRESAPAAAAGGAYLVGLSLVLRCLLGRLVSFQAGGVPRRHIFFSPSTVTLIIDLRQCTAQYH